MINSIPTHLPNQPPPPASNGTGPFPPPLRRRLSVNETFQPGHQLWQEHYDGYLEAKAGEVAEEVPNGASNEYYIEAQIGGRKGYIPKDILTDI